MRFPVEPDYSPMVNGFRVAAEAHLALARNYAAAAEALAAMAPEPPSPIGTGQQEGTGMSEQPAEATPEVDETPEVETTEATPDADEATDTDTDTAEAVEGTEV